MWIFLIELYYKEQFLIVLVNTYIYLYLLQPADKVQFLFKVDVQYFV